jgi:hypothetical protein
MVRGFSRRGQPLLALVFVLGSWISARAMLWDASAAPVPPRLSIALPNTNTDASVEPSFQHRFADASPGRPVAGFSPIGDLLAVEADVAGPPAPKLTRIARRSVDRPQPGYVASIKTAFVPTFNHPFDLAEVSSAPRSRTVSTRLTGPLTSLVAVQPSGGALLPASQAIAKPGRATRRWSSDSWFLLRSDGTAPLAAGMSAPSYGASQAGMVLRYRLARDSKQRPTAYLRTTTALNGSGEREAAVGLSLRPFSRIPVIAAGEARVTGTSAGYILRPAAFLVTELPSFSLPMGMRGEAYGQAGYVAGQFATGFLDGQLRLDQSLFRLGQGDFRFGGGIWGGVQRGAARAKLAECGCPQTGAFVWLEMPHPHQDRPLHCPQVSKALALSSGDSLS